MVSWKFKPIGEWPLVMVTSPADQLLIIDASRPSQVVRGLVRVRARVWGSSIQGVTFSVDGGELSPMAQLDGSTWSEEWDAAQLEDGPHELTVTVESDRIVVCVNRGGEYDPPAWPPRRERAGFSR